VRVAGSLASAEMLPRRRRRARTFDIDRRTARCKSMRAEFLRFELLSPAARCRTAARADRCEGRARMLAIMRDEVALAPLAALNRAGRRGPRCTGCRVTGRRSRGTIGVNIEQIRGTSCRKPDIGRNRRKSTTNLVRRSGPRSPPNSLTGIDGGCVWGDGTGQLRSFSAEQTSAKSERERALDSTNGGGGGRGGEGGGVGGVGGVGGGGGGGGWWGGGGVGGRLCGGGGGDG
jgi:hypothetical protein